MAIASASEWKKLLKSTPDTIEAAALTKALEALDKADGKARGEWLEAVSDRAELVKRKNAKNKAIVEFVTELGRAAEKELKSAAATGADEDEEAELTDGEGLLKDPEQYGKYVRLSMKKLRKTPLTFALGLAKKPEETRFLFHRVKEGPALSMALKRETDLKVLTWGVAGAHAQKPNVLVLSLDGRQLPGLAKRCRLFLKEFKPLPFSEVQLLVEGNEVEDLPEEEERAETVAAPPPPPPPPPPESNPATQFAARLKTLKPRLEAAISAKTADSEQFKLWSSEMGVFARKKDFAAAVEILDRIEQALGQAAPAERPGAPRIAPKVLFQQSRLAWGATRQKIKSELQKLESAILATYQGHEGYASVETGVRKLDSVLEKFDESLADKLDEALNAEDEDTRARLHGEAREIIERYQGFLESDPLVKRLDDNPFVPIAVQATLSKTLGTLASKLA